jgi:sugar/nucleoside kinase (ribokinase family)
MTDWIPGTKLCVPAFKISHGEVNANGAGDALFSGFCLAASSWAARKQSNDWKVTPAVAGKFASLVAWQRCDAKTRDGKGMRSADTLMEMIRQNDLPESL